MIPSCQSEHRWEGLGREGRGPILGAEAASLVPHRKWRDSELKRRAFQKVGGGSLSLCCTFYRYGLPEQTATGVLWPECLCPPQTHMLTLTPNEMALGRGAFGR